MCNFLVIFKSTVYYLLKCIKFSVKKQNIKKIYWKSQGIFSVRKSGNHVFGQLLRGLKSSIIDCISIFLQLRDLNSSRNTLHQINRKCEWTIRVSTAHTRLVFDFPKSQKFDPLFLTNWSHLHLFPKTSSHSVTVSPTRTPPLQCMPPSSPRVPLPPCTPLRYACPPFATHPPLYHTCPSLPCMPSPLCHACHPPLCHARPALWTEWLTDRCKNITFPQLSLWAVIKSFVVDLNSFCFFCTDLKLWNVMVKLKIEILN